MPVSFRSSGEMPSSPGHFLFRDVSAAIVVVQQLVYMEQVSLSSSSAAID